MLKNSKEALALIELKEGIICNGKISQVDEFFNILVTNVIVTSKNGSYFKKLDHFYIRGRNIKLLRFS